MAVVFRMPVAAALIVAAAVNASAQTAQRPQRGFIGVGWALGTDDAPNRTAPVNSLPAARQSLVIEGDAFRIKRTGFGFEFSRLGAVASEQVFPGAVLDDSEREASYLGVVRQRVFGRERTAVDIVGGIGVMTSHRETTVSSLLPSGRRDTTQVDRRAPEWMAGADLQFTIAPYLAIVPEVRLRRLSRGRLPREIPANVTQRSSVQLVAAMTMRAIW